MHTLYLIDSSIYVFRAWHMLPGSITSAAGEPANAVYGFSEFLLKLIETETPSHMVCAFDQNSDGCARRRIYPDYKANRPAAPEDLKKQFAWAREFAEALGLPCFASHSLEADDIIGTLANRARAQQARSIILSADKDLAQFVGKDDMIWDYARNRRQTIADIRKRYRINPGQIPDMLALAGDAVDNIPGVPGIGIHTAARLLIKW
ncbi:MAG: hypothetical protein KDJ38_03535, partial [Gammaproteobacteria bacterium]|nr:hypothetical protein [Gammaproteobacteria bacterium]